MFETSHIVVCGRLGQCGGPVQQALAAEGYRRVSFVEGSEAVIALCTHMRVDVLLLALGSTCCDALAVAERLAGPIGDGSLHVIVTTDASSHALLPRALALGVRDFVREPIEPAEVALRVRHSLTASALGAELRARNNELQRAIVARSNELAGARREVLGRLAVATEFRDDDTGEHTERVGRTAAAIAAGVGLDPELVRMIRSAAPLHDVGKIGIPDSILLKAGGLTARERAIMRSHTRIGAAILADSEVPELQLAEQIALSHHERYDGSGYPDRLAGGSIPIAARIVAIADVFDALVFARPYKAPWPVSRALDEIASQRGRHFDPDLVDVFAQLDHRRLRAPMRGDSTGRLSGLAGGAAAVGGDLDALYAGIR